MCVKKDVWRGLKILEEKNYFFSDIENFHPFFALPPSALGIISRINSTFGVFFSAQIHFISPT